MMSVNNLFFQIFNPYNRGTESPDFQYVNVPDLVSAEPDDKYSQRDADVQHFINFDFYPKDNYDFHRENLYGFNQGTLRGRNEDLSMNGKNK